MITIHFQIGFFLEPIIHTIYLDETPINYLEQKGQKALKGFKNISKSNTKSK